MPNCPHCHSPLPNDAPDGICPLCLLTEGIGLAAESHFRKGSFLPPEPADIGLLFPEFEVEALIGRGGMGAVYRAREMNGGRIVAIKILPPEIAADPEFLERFRAEATTLERLSHPNIVEIYQLGEREDYAFFVMEHIDGTDLARRFQEEPRTLIAEAEKIVSQLCDALEYSHANGVIHRDIKPSNILIDAAGTIKVADFGLAKLRLAGESDLGLTMTREVMGTVHYMAPELSSGAAVADPRSDCYATGVLIYEMLTGQLPVGRFELPSQKVPGLHRGIDDVVARALSSEPEKRFRTASALAQAFSKAVRTPPIPPWKIYAAAAATVVLIAGAAATFWPHPTPSAALSGTVLVKQLSAGNSVGEVEIALSAATSQGISPDMERTNRGDYWLNFSDPDATTTGTLITSIAENGRLNLHKGTSWGKLHATSSFTFGSDVPKFVISTSRVDSGEEYNLNVAFGWFPFDRFLSGHAIRRADSRSLQTLYSPKSITLGTHFNMLPQKPGAVQIDLRDLGASSKEGILLASVAENLDYFALTHPQDDGTFSVYTLDNDIPQTNRLRAISFVFIPASEAGSGKIVAVGRVCNNASTSVGGGGFQVRKSTQGTWHLSITGFTAEMGTLLLTPISTPEGNNQNNMVSYSWDDKLKHYVVQSRDLPEANLEDGATPSEPMFNFVFLTP